MESRRPYRSRLRSAQAAQTRERILAAAAGEFSRRGYAGTSIPAIAEAAGVSPETVKSHGAKHELLLAAFEYTFAGREGDAPIADDEAVRAARADVPPEGLPDFFADLAATLSARGAGLWAAFSAAARSDDAVAAVHRDLLARRLEDHGRVVDIFRAHGMLTGDRSRDDLAAELAHLASPEGYLLLVEGYGWTAERYRAWLAAATRRLLADG